MNRNLVFVTCALLSIGACVLFGCGRPIIRYPSCGEYHRRESDGAVCRECVDERGRFAQCGMRVLKKKP